MWNGTQHGWHCTEITTDEPGSGISTTSMDVDLDFLRSIRTGLWVFKAPQC